MEQKLKKLITYALNNQISDIHFLMKNNQISTQIRKNGVLMECSDVACDVRFFRYLQYRSNLELSMTSVPQTGGFEILIENMTISVRFSLIQSFQMTSGVLRIMNTTSTLTMEKLFLYPEHLRMIKKAFHRENGLILITGPTGSGKTTILYTCLKALHDRMIYTVEDPIEVIDDHFVQLQVNEAQNFSYEQSIRQLMRHDPDVIMIGEIRDGKAAKGAVQCALTGHLVCATLHASNCLMAIERMKDLGISEQLLKDVVVLISSQRLLEGIHRQKIGAYEIMDHGILETVFDTHQKPELFHDLMENVRWLEKHRFVSTFETDELFD